MTTEGCLQAGTEPNDGLPPSDVDALCNYAVQVSQRDFLLNTHCVAAGISNSDVFAKAREYAAIVRRAHQSCEIPYGVPMQSKPGPTVTLNFGGKQRRMVMFASNDYLNLSTDERVHEAVRRTMAEFGVGAGSSRVNAGYSALHQRLEEKLAVSFGKQAALVLPTGYDAMVAAPQSMLTPEDRVIVDGSSHACILEGARSSGAVVRVFAHNDPHRLEQTLKLAREKSPDSGLMVLVEGAYSMDGDIARLPEIAGVCRRYGARLLVDEAHAIGVYGARGHGVTEHFGLSADVDIIGGTFSKSLGAVGGFVAGDEDVILYLRYMSRRSVFSAALPPMLIAAVLASLDIVENDTSLRERLWNNVRYLGAGLRDAGATLLGMETASVPVLIGDDGVIFRFCQDMMAAGVFTFPAVYPTVPRNRSLFRLAVQAGHKKEHLDHAIEVMARLLRKYNKAGRESHVNSI